MARLWPRVLMPTLTNAFQRVCGSYNERAPQNFESKMKTQCTEIKQSYFNLPNAFHYTKRQRRSFASVTRETATPQHPCGVVAASRAIRVGSCHVVLTILSSRGISAWLAIMSFGHHYHRRRCRRRRRRCDVVLTLLFVVRRSSFVVRRSSFVVRRSSFVVRRSGRSSFVVRRSSFVVRRSVVPSSSADRRLKIDCLPCHFLTYLCFDL